MARSLFRKNHICMFTGVGTWTHDYPITFDIAQKLQLPVSVAIPDEVMQLMSLYAQPVRRQASVEYLSKPRHSERPEARWTRKSP